MSDSTGSRQAGRKAGRRTSRRVLMGDSTERMEMGETQGLYHVALRLAGRRCLVVGGGAVAHRKAAELLQCGAKVRVVATEWRADFRPLLASAHLELVPRPFRAEDVEGVFLAVAATDDPEAQAAVAAAADGAGVPCNVASAPEKGSVILPATLQRGALTVAVSTSGQSPLLAVAVRNWLASQLGAGLEPGADRMGEAREIVRRRFPGDPERRKRELVRLLTTDAFQCLVEGRTEEFERRWNDWRASL